MFKSPHTKNMVWFEGVVEDRIDPLKLGRVRVRVLGMHTDDKAEIPSESLHWAQIVHPVTSAAINGIGETPALLPGTHVVGFFRDGTSAQDPIIMGAVGGIPQSVSSPGVGFNDPTGVYPKETHIDEPDTSRHARNEFKEDQQDDNGYPSDLHPKKREQRLRGVVDGDVESNPLSRNFLQKDKAQSDRKKFLNNGSEKKVLEQPEQPYAAEYPYNKTIQTESGHVIEYDDTPQNERICVSHRSGSFVEMHPDGTVTIKSVNDTYKLTQKDNTEIVLADNNVHIQDNSTLFIGKDFNINVAGNVNWHTKGNWNQYVGGTTTELNVGDVSITHQANNNTKVSDNYNIQVGFQTYTDKAPGDNNSVLDGAGKYSLTTTGKSLDGNITVQSLKASISSTAKVNINEDAENINNTAGAQINSNASAVHTITGSKVNIN